jgi:FkbM family methyltransferase
MLVSIRLKIIKMLIETYEFFYFNRKISKAIKQINPCTVIDVGANKGDFIKLILSNNKNCQIHAFEPNPNLFRELNSQFPQYTIKLNKLAVSDSIESKEFYENIFNLTSSLHKPNLESNHSKKKIKTFGIKPNDLIKKTYHVQTTTLSNYIKINNLEKIDLIKIDTEGHEYSCLMGLFENINCEINYIQIEEHITESYTESTTKCKKILTENNFTELVKFKHHIGNFYDVIFINNKTLK